MMDGELRVRVLGGAELAVGGHPLVELASAKAAALLCYLAVTGAGHPRSELAGLLWSDLPEPTARANLRLVLTKLRRVLPEHLDVTRQTVALAGGPPVWVDAVEVSRVAAADGTDHAELLAAARLCRGEFLDGFGIPGAPVFDEWVAGRRATARADMLALLDRAVQWAVDEGDAATGIEVVRRMLELEPLHEEAHRALMWFLAMGGQRSAALAQYETCRYLLREELEIEPSAATVALRDEIADAGGFTELGVPASAGHSDQARLSTTDVPRPLTTLIGRGAELARLHELLDDPACRLVTLVGPGGIGKTRLAMEVAASRQDRHRDGAVFVSFVGTSPARPDEAADLVVADLARALGASLAVPRDPLELLADHLVAREVLLVLDNLEHLRDGAGVIAELLRRAPGVQVLVTSRRQLGLGVEWLVEVPGLPYPPVGADADAAGYEAVRLFAERARLLRPGFRADEGTARVCRLVAGVPLAIELAARWARSATATAIADRLAGGLELLETTSPDVDRRHRSLRSVFDWSYELLTDAERRAFRRLSVLRRGFDLAGAAAVAGAGLPLLAGLVDQSLVAAGDDGRYSMHELVRQYAAERLAADPAEESGARRRHAEHYASLLPAPAEALVDVIDVSVDGVPDLDAEAENLRAATDWLIRVADPVALDAHLLRVWALYRRLGWFREARAFFVVALEREEIPPLQRAHWHRMLGEAHQQLGEANAARHHLERALRALGARVPATAPGWLKVLVVQVARRTFGGPGDRVERRRERRDAALERAAATFTIVEVYWVLEDQLPMLPAALWSLNDAERAGEPDLLARAHAGLGMILGTIGLHRFARRHLTAARAGVERTTDPLTACWVGIMGGLHWMGVGDWAAVEAGAARALALRDRTPMHRWADELLLIAGVGRYLTSRYEAAAAAAAEGMASGRDRRDPVVHMWGLVILIETTLRTNPDDPALAGWSADAARLLSKVARIDAARLHAATARLHLAAGRRAEAWQAARAADRLIGPRPSFEQYGLEAHAGVAEVCLTLLEQVPGNAVDPDDAELRATAAVALHRLRRYARTFPMARPRALICVGWHAWLAGHAGAARRAWARAVREGENLRMPYELARAHHELGRHLAPGERSPLGLDRAAHLERAVAGYRTAGCGADVRRVQALDEQTTS